MRIKEINIKKYGPIENKVYKLGNFTLFYGPNESGKTMMVDAILRLLIGKKKGNSSIYKDIKGIDRVSEDPAGFVLIDKNGEEVTISSGEFAKTFKIQPDELRGILIIRNSDLTITENESSVYSQVADKLVSTDINKIKVIRERISDRAVTTDRGEYKNQEGKKYKDKYNVANLLVEEIEKLTSTLKEKKYDTMEIEMSELLEEQKQIEDTIKKVKLLKKKELVKDCKKLLEDLKRIEKELSTVEIYSENDLENISVRESKIENTKKQLEGLEGEINRLREKLNNISVELRDKNYYLPEKISLNNKAESLIDEISSYKQTYIKKDVYKRRAATLKKWSYIPLVAAGIIFLIFLLLNRNLILPFLISAGLTVISIVCFAVLKNTNNYLKKEEEEKNKILSEGSAIFSMGFNDIAELEYEIMKSQKQFKEFDEERKRLGFEETSHETFKNDLEKKHQELLAELSREQDLYNKTLLALKVANKEELKEKLEHKHLLDSERKKVRSILVKNLEVLTNSKLNDNEPIELLEHTIESLLSQELALLENQSDEELGSLIRLDIDELDEKNAEINQRLEKLRSAISIFQNTIHKIAAEALRYGLSECLPVDDIDNLYISDIEKLKENLLKFIKELERQKEYDEIARNILSEIEVEEKSTISRLFTESNLIKIFTDITDNRYTVQYDDKKNRPVVIDGRGRTFEPYQLSAGTYDQLYFSIRLALAEQLFGNEKAFFILDDPFIKYDKNRLKKQLEKLFELSKQGWQFVYFTAKDEVLETLENLQVPDSTNNALKDIQIYNIVDS
ncbi:ATP-binding protein [Fervidobacterium gondwanense]|uniref:AAA domain-containing protein n=1 Tax=Fervidobacterium gondwanense DSM 13020 TaxID=1121883 RepID=A0A1M7SUV0_FERGO|nr:AAA family ATPase [Fervidobacterium gondwanense]SHN62146.1 AAA domain-containing protein [Fervidobacterium gondwanense DSM 13020]